MTTVSAGTTTGQSLLYSTSGAPGWGYPAWSTLVGAPTSLPPNGIAGGDLSLTYPNPQVSGLLSHALPSLPGSSQYLEYVPGTGFTWATPAGGGGGPPTGAASGDLFGTYPNPGVSGLLSHAIPSLPGFDGYLHFTGSSLAWSALPTSLPPSGAASGDLNNFYPNPTVTGIRGFPLPALSGSDAYLHYTGTSWQLTALPTSLPPNGTAGGDLSLTYPNPHVSGLLGSSLPSLPGSSQYLEYVPGTGFVWNTPAGGGGGVTSLTASTGLSVNASTGAITITNTAPMVSNSVPNGLTGITTCAAGSVVQGNGTSPLLCTTGLTNHGVVMAGGSGAVTASSPGNVGDAFMSGGFSANGHFGTLGIAGGGTGASSFAPNALIIGNTASPFQVLSDLSGYGSGGILESTPGVGVGWQVVQRPSTQSTSGALSYGVPIGAPTVWSQLASFPVTIPAGGANIAAHMDFQWDMPPLTSIICGGACLPCYELVVFGIGVDSPTVATVTSLATPPTAYSPSPVDSNGSNSLNYGTFLSAGSHVIYSLSKVQNGNCAINLSSDAVLDVFP